MTDGASIDGVTLVTGGTGGVGHAVLAELLDAGAEVVATWIVERERDAVREAVGDREGLHMVEADLLSEGGAAGAVAAAAERGPLRALVNLAGGFAAGGRLHEAAPEELDRLLALNLGTAVASCRAALPELIAAGSSAIVCVGARNALRPFSGGAYYAIAKAAVLALVRTLEVEYRDDGVRANAVLPSVLDTPANREASPDADYERWVTPQQLARVIRFLCSEDSAPISGAEIPVYGQA
jgi:NAD(P)-dependent dehydrogenase (short-subunit alcohol dehydrogenase family)